MVYTHENRFLVGNAKNIIDAAGISTCFKNEYAAGAAGDLAPLDSWLEVWVVEAKDYVRAAALVDDAFSDNFEPPWLCSHCQEHNESSFEICWSCQTEKTQ